MQLMFNTASHDYNYTNYRGLFLGAEIGLSLGVGLGPQPTASWAMGPTSGPICGLCEEQLDLDIEKYIVRS